MGDLYYKWFMSFLFISIMGILFPLLLISGDLTHDLWVSFVITTYSASRLSYIIVKSRVRILEITFFIFVYIFLGLAPLIQISDNQFPWGGGYSNLQFFEANVVIIIGIIGYEIGLKFHKTNKKYKLNEKTPDKNYNFNAYFIFILVCLASFIFSSMFLGVSNVFVPRNEISTSLQTSSYLVLSKLQQVPLLIALIVSLSLLKSKYYSHFNSYGNIYISIISIVLLLMNLFISNPISSARYWVGTVYISILISVIDWKKITQTHIIFGAVGLILIVFPYADVFRNTLDFNFQIQDINYTLAHGDFDAFQQIINANIFTDLYGYSWGYQLLGVLFFWVPRTIWPSKPVGTGWTVGEGLGYDFLNISAPLWSEFLVNFSYIGVFVCFIIYGYLTSALQKNYEISVKYKIMNFSRIFVPIFTGYQLFLLRGDLLSTFAYLAPIILYIYIYIYIS